MTAPSDAALENDIRLSLTAGFNGARLHQKVFEERFLYTPTGWAIWFGASLATGASAGASRSVAGKRTRQEKSSEAAVISAQTFPQVM